MSIPNAAQGRGFSAVTSDEFSFTDAVGGVRGLVESVLPGFLFIVVFVATRELSYALIAAVAVSLIAVILRLINHTPITQALGGMLGIAIGVIWAWRSGEAQNFFAFGLWQNAVYLVGVLIALAFRWPAVGVVVELMKSAAGAQKELRETPADANDDEPMTNPFAGSMAWRKDPNLRKRYTMATWIWVALFAIRLGVQVPLFFNNAVGWLGTARLILGTPLWAVVLYLTWAIIRNPHRDADVTKVA